MSPPPGRLSFKFNPSSFPKQQSLYAYIPWPPPHLYVSLTLSFTWDHGDTSLCSKGEKTVSVLTTCRVQCCTFKVLVNNKITKPISRKTVLSWHFSKVKLKKILSFLHQLSSQWYPSLLLCLLLLPCCLESPF